MKKAGKTRRDFMKTMGAAAAALPLGLPRLEGGSLTVDPQPKFELSPYLYMQFMEPLGTTDGSVAAAWDFMHDCWRKDVIEVTRKLAPTLMRWGGCFSSFYRWREGVGPRDQRKPMLNMCWGGIDTNQVGTHEFVDFCRQVGAEPFYCVNFESDGRKYWMRDPKGSDRCAGPEEAAEWVAYCNDPSNKERIGHGVKEPYDIKMWQIGNETSYARDAFTCEEAAKRTVVFAEAMRKRDPSITLIGWGDSGWAKQMAKIAGEHIQYLAFHHMFNPDRGLKNSPLQGTEYRKDPAWTWERLMNAKDVHEARVKWMREQVGGLGIPMALTECHFALPGRNRCEVLSTWAAGVANARLLNVHERHGDLLKIATLADFCGTRWQVNAVMIPVPWGQSFLMPVALVMSLFRHHTGEKAVEVKSAPDHLDVTASRTGDRIFLHVVNTHRVRSIEAPLQIMEREITQGRIFEMAADPEVELIQTRPDVVKVEEKVLPKERRWTFPPASVSAVELDTTTV